MSRVIEFMAVMMVGIAAGPAEAQAKAVRLQGGRGWQLGAARAQRARRVVCSKTDLKLSFR